MVAARGSPRPNGEVRLWNASGSTVVLSVGCEKYRVLDGVRRVPSGHAAERVGEGSEFRAFSVTAAGAGGLSRTTP